jgi:hypothetical protein
MHHHQHTLLLQAMRWSWLQAKATTAKRQRPPQLQHQS